MTRIVFAIVLLSAGSLALAQQRRGQSTTEATAKPQPQRAITVQRAPQLINGSLLQSELQIQPDPQRADLAAISYMAVPEPEPNIIHKHDLITIIIREESEFSSEGTTETTKDASLQMAINDLVKLNFAEMQINPGGVSQPLNIDMDGSREFNGEGTVDRTDSLTARIQAEVIDVKPNGNIVVQGRKRITTDEEVQEFIVTGTCRAEDVTIDNAVFSTQLHDFDIKKSHKGAVRDATKRGWGPRLLDFINPF